MVLQTFPLDIFLHILDLLDKESLLNLRFVCQTIHDVATPIALHDIRFFVGHGPRGDYQTRINAQLETCASPLPNVYQHARHFRFYLNTYYMARYASTDLLPDLWKTIAKLCFVTSFTLEWEVRERHDVAQLETLKSMPLYLGNAVESLIEATGGRLEKLIVKPDPSNNWFPHSLSKFRGVKSLQVVRDRYGYNCPHFRPEEDEDPSCFCVELPMAAIFGPLIAANPDIEELEVAAGCHIRGFDPNIVLPSSLTKLSSLTVGGLDFAREGFPIQTSLDIAPLRNLRHLSTSSMYGPLKLDVLWTSMRQGQIPLETLVTRQVSLPLVQYLCSFSGLRSLEIRNIQDRPECSSSEITSTFLTQVLPLHSETLEHLHLSFDTDTKPISGWTFDLVSWPAALSRLTKLRTLAIHPPAHPHLSWYSDEEDGVVESYQTVIDYVENLPRLKALTLVSIDRTFRCGTGAMTWARRGSKKLSSVAPKLVGKTGRPRVLELYNGRHVIKERDGGEDRNGVHCMEKWGWERVVYWL